MAATIAYCAYVYNRYGRLLAYSAPFRTGIGDQASQIDVEFYEKFYRPEALSPTDRAQ